MNNGNDHNNQKCNIKSLILITDVQRVLEQNNYDQLLKNTSLNLPETRRKKLEQIKNREDWIRSLAAGVLLNRAVSLYQEEPDRDDEKIEKDSKQDNSRVEKQTVLNIDLINELAYYNKNFDYKQEYGENKKPYFVDHPNIYFNLSHSGRYVVCVISNHECGIDIEGERRLKTGVAERFFSDIENGWLKESELEWQSRFLRLWTTKEAYAKATGDGIFREINKIHLIPYLAGNDSEQYSLRFENTERNDIYQIKEIGMEQYRISVVIRKTK